MPMRWRAMRRLCQEANIVPIVEPEVLMDGGHTLERCEQVTAAALDSLFAELAAHRVDLTGTVLKPNMVISGTECANRAGVAGSGRSDGTLSQGACSRGPAGHCISVGRPIR